MIDLILKTPMYFYVGVYHIWWAVQGLPWPTGDDWFRWALFFSFGKLIWWLVSSKKSRRGSEQGAAASIGSLFDHR